MAGIFQSFIAGQQARQADDANQLSMLANQQKLQRQSMLETLLPQAATGDADALGKLAGADPEAALGIQKFLEGKSAQQKQQARDALVRQYQIARDIDSQPSLEAQNQLLQQHRQAILNAGGDVSKIPATWTPGLSKKLATELMTADQIIDREVPKAAEPTTDQRNAAAYASDPNFRSYTDRTRQAAVGPESLGNPVEELGPDGKPIQVQYGNRGTRRVVPGAVPAPKGKQGGQLPTSALKMQQESLDVIGTASAINSDLSVISQQIAEGKLDLGPMSNMASSAMNATGFSSEASRNYASFKSTLEKLRNDSLRLNKGVQTEGDAQRAWNEIISNINDPALVRQRLAEVQKINQRAVDLRRLDIDTIRANFGAEPLDVSGYQNQPPALTPPAQQPNSGGIKFLGFE